MLRFPASRLPFHAGAALAALLMTACTQVNVHGDPKAWVRDQANASAAAPLRVATYNTSLYDDADGGLIRRLEADDGNARKIAAVLQRVRPDVVLLNEFDYDAQQRAAELFQRDYLEVAQDGGGAALSYPYRYLAPVNTGVPSGLDLDGDGLTGDVQRGDRARGNDAWGYGLHPGQYGMLVLSRYPIDAAAVRTFQTFKWSALPGARQPRHPDTGKPWYSATAWPQMRLSSKSHWDVPVRTPLGVLHLLAAHPTPPVFDGPEDRNGARNHDEIKLWARYLDGGTPAWLCDDQGRCGGLAEDARFVIVGDMNADPVDGDGVPGSIRQLLEHPRVNASQAPRSEGAIERAKFYGFARKGDSAEHTGDFGPKAGTLRLDYALPSRGWNVRGTGVFWPKPGTADAKISEASDHHLVWVDLAD